MKIEPLLPLGKLDPGVRAADNPMDIGTIGAGATEVEALGYDGLVVEETKEDPYVVIALAAQATRTLGLATSVALAFPRSPTVTAMTAWTLQKLSQGLYYYPKESAFGKTPPDENMLVESFLKFSSIAVIIPRITLSPCLSSEKCSNAA